jgi:hypothetical protein
MKKIIVILILHLTVIGLTVGFSQIKVKDLNNTSTGTTADYLIKDDAAGIAGSTKKITILDFLNTYSATINGNVPSWNLIGNTGSPAYFLGFTDASILKIRTNNLERMRIDANGNMGIGTTSATQLFQVNGYAGYFSAGGHSKDSLSFCDSMMVRRITNTIPNAWSLIGNTGTTPGTNFIGTKDAVDFVFKINNLESGRIGFTKQNTSLGYVANWQNTSGTGNTAFGFSAMNMNTSGTNNTSLGNSSLSFITNVSGDVALGYYAGAYTTSGNEFYLNNQDRVNYAGDTTKSLLYGKFTASGINNQWLRLNGTLKIAGNVGIGTNVPVTLTHWYASDTALSTTTKFLTLDHASTGTVTTGFGTGINFNLQNSTGSLINSGLIENEWSSSIAGAERSQMSFDVRSGVGMITRFRISASGAQIGGAGESVPGNAFEIYPTSLANNGVGAMIRTFPASLTSLTASTESNDIYFNLSRTAGYLTGNITNQRAMLITPPTYSFVAGSTITNAATMAISGAPTAGTNATITNNYALWVQAGRTALNGQFQLADGTQGSGFILGCDANGVAGWADPNLHVWGLLGNSVTTPGTNFIGTTDAQALVFKTNATEWMRITTLGGIAFNGSTNYGSANQVLTSNGNAPPTWQNAAGGGWSLTGNSGTTVGTNFIGTTDDKDWEIKVNNNPSGYIASQAGSNVFFGYNAGAGNLSGNIDNTGIGWGCLNANASGTQNVAVGTQALNNATGNNNTAIGAQALAFTTGGHDNTSVGQLSGAHLNGNYNVAVGVGTISAAGSAVQNVAVGWFAGGTMTGTQNVFVGGATAYNMITGDNNTWVGNDAGETCNGITGSIFLGNFAGYRSTESNILKFGNQTYTSEANEKIYSPFYAHIPSNNSSQGNDLRLNFLNVAIGGTVTPTHALEVNGSAQIIDGTQGAGKVFTSDANGVGSWGTILPSNAKAFVTAQSFTTGVTSPQTVLSYTTSASDNFYHVSGTLNLTAISLDHISLQVVYTDESGNSNTTTMQLVSTNTFLSFAAATGSYAVEPLDIRVKASTVITIQVNPIVGTGSATFNAGAIIQQE